MKKLTLIFTALIFVLGISVISCTKDNTQTNPAIITATDAVQVDFSVTEISGIIDDYQTLNAPAFVDPTLKAGVADGPATTAGLKLDNCATVTIVKTPVMTANAVTGATIKFTIDYGTTGCVGKDGKARRGTIVSTFTWVKEGGWSRESTIDIYVSDIHHVGTQSLTFGVTGANKHAYITERTTLKVTAKDGSWRNWISERQRELLEGNGGVNPVKIWKITGVSSFSNSTGETATYTISATDPLIKRSDCKTFTSGTVTTVNKAGATTIVTYAVVAPQTCPDGFTVKTPSDKNGKGAITRFIRFGI